MRGQFRSAAAVVAAIGSVVALPGCGGSSNSAQRQAGTAIIASSTPPQSADNQSDFTTQGSELYSVVNTPLLVFKRAPGTAGSVILPGLARRLPKISKDGLTYTFRLRKGLKYSTGVPIKAGDFKFAIRRALKLNWDASEFLTGHIVGAMEFAKGSAGDISGITTNDKTGRIAVRLTVPYGPVLDVLALPGTAPLPQSTPMQAQPATGTVGDGPYKWSTINPKHDYVLVKNPAFNGVPASSVPPGHLNTIDYRVNPDATANAQAVLNNSEDVFDPTDTIDPSILPQVSSKAGDRYRAVPTNSTFYFFMAVNQKPFNNLAARQAVVAAIDQRMLSKIDGGFLTPDCHLIPAGIPGSSSPSSCPFGDPSKGPNLALAKQLMAKSGQQGAPVVVWGQNQPPRDKYVDYLTQLLNTLGFKATKKKVAAKAYFKTVGDAKTKPQIGFADWLQDFPHPDDFVQLFVSASILPQNSENYGYVRDPKVDSTEAQLSQIPASKLQSVASQWAGLDQYMVRQGYYAAYGHEEFPKFYSNRLNFRLGVLTDQYQTDLTSLQPK